ncbi:MAG TPA: NAD-binding protein [Allosphingosinicella sp.]|nr:NAD-binding protein [Allosphingosinicella sp.]
MDGLVFCIGTFAKRVNFLAQQRRALNLIWALHELNLLGKSPRAAVVGGGLAGVTAAGALMAFGVKVDLFEAGRRVLHLQRETAHRRAHPTINGWPHEQIRLDAELPFFDWATGLCSEVAEEIAKEFEGMMKAEGNEIYERNEVQDIVSTGADVVRIIPEYPAKREAFNLVIVTAGFGREVNGTPFRCESYWRGDNLEPERDDLNDNFVVSGCGDGGLIDALRLLHLDFDKGRLAFSVARRLAGSPLAEAIKKAETIARSGGSLADLAVAYEAAAQQLGTRRQYAAIHRDLVRSANKFKGVVYLGDHHLEKPYSLRAAPIHKLLVAHASKVMAKISYNKSAVAETEKGEVQFAKRCLKPPPSTKVVVRHGAAPSLQHVLPNAFEALKTKQEALPDSFADPAWPASFDYPVPKALNAYDRGSRKFAWSRFRQAQRALSEIFTDVSVQPLPGRLTAQINEALPADAPTSLFQLQIDYQPVPESDAL